MENNDTLEVIQRIPLDKLRPYPDHPFGVRDDDMMQQTVESVKQFGVLVPGIARPLPDGTFELIAGHRRKQASAVAGLDDMPIIVRGIDRNAATIIMVDSNLQRENILPSEKAYAVSAFQLHVSGYLMKPITPEAVQKELDHIKGVKATEKLLTIKCFGNFEVLYNGEILPFKRKKAKELLAVLIDRNGAGMTAKQICAILFPDDTDDAKNAAYLRQLVLDLKNTLKTVRAEDVLQHDTPYYRIDTNLVRCDYLSFLETGKPEFHGEYMTQYSWAEETCAMLQFKK